MANAVSSQPIPPPAAGVRLLWEQLPVPVRAAVEAELGSAVIHAVSQPGGFSPGVAARLQLADGRRVFVKAVGVEQNPDTPHIHRREAMIMQMLPANVPAPRMLASYDQDGWVALVFQDIEGVHPAQPWDAAEFERVLTAVAGLSAALTPSPLPVGVAEDASAVFSGLAGWRRAQRDDSTRAKLDPWSLRHLDQLAAIEHTVADAVAGDTLLHLDMRADNMLLTPERVWFVDWPHASIGAPWVDLVCLLPSVRMQGGPSPESVIVRHPSSRNADPAAITAAVVALAGYFTRQSLQPPPPGLPTLRAFQAAQAEAARSWAGERLGLKEDFGLGILD